MLENGFSAESAFIFNGLAGADHAALRPESPVKLRDFNQKFPKWHQAGYQNGKNRV